MLATSPVTLVLPESCVFPRQLFLDRGEGPVEAPPAGSCRSNLRFTPPIHIIDYCSAAPVYNSIMHKSLAPAHSEGLPRPCQICKSRPFPTAATALTGLGSLVLLALACVLAFLPNPAACQDQPPATGATQGQSVTPTPAPANGSFELSDEVVRDVLSDFQRGFETQNLDRVLAVFDPLDMRDYPQFRDQLIAFFRLHESVKLRYQLLQVTADDGLGSATADIEMDANPLDSLPTPRRRSTQMRFQLKREAKGWKIIGLRPPDFFAP